MAGLGDYLARSLWCGPLVYLLHFLAVLFPDYCEQLARRKTFFVDRFLDVYPRGVAVDVDCLHARRANNVAAMCWSTIPRIPTRASVWGFVLVILDKSKMCKHGGLFAMCASKGAPMKYRQLGLAQRSYRYSVPFYLFI